MIVWQSAESIDGFLFGIGQLCWVQERVARWGGDEEGNGEQVTGLSAGQRKMLCGILRGVLLRGVAAAGPVNTSPV